MSRIGLAMIVKDEADVIVPTLLSVRELVDHWTIVDTGSTDGTPELVGKTLEGIAGELVERPWVDYGTNRTEALELARDTADWVLMLDADTTVEAHAGLGEWLAGDPDPTVGAWRVPIVDHGTVFWRPQLTRGGLDWRYLGAVHEYLDDAGRAQRQILGLSLIHRGAGRGDRLEDDLELLRPGLDAGEPRAVFYYAETLRYLGRLEEAADVYRRRVTLGGFVEEAWYSELQIAKIAGDVGELLRVYTIRPWRPEALLAAARIVAAGGYRDDSLFLEPIP